MNKTLLSLFTFLVTVYGLDALTINEIMYDPEGSDTGREWVEVYNEGGSDIDLSGYKFFESSTNHGVTSYQGGTAIKAGGYAIIADTPSKFLADYPSYSGVLFDSSFSLSNTGEFIALKDSSLAVVDSITYAPALGGGDDGTALSLIDGVWKRGSSTPGLPNVEGTAKIPPTESPSISKTASPATDLTLLLPEEKVVLAGADAMFSARAINSEGKTPDGMMYTWAFGDGGEGKGKSVAYHYRYPGSYLATIDGDNGLVESLAKLRVKVIEPNISIKQVGKDINGLFIDVENATPYELDLSGWKISINGLRYDIPKNTFILAKNITRFSGDNLGISTSTIPATTTLAFPNDTLLVTSSFFGIASSSVLITVPTILSFNNKVRAESVANTRAVVEEGVVAIKSIASSTPATSTYKMVSSMKNDSRIVDLIKSLFGY